MNDREKRMQHAMVSFAMMGGLLVKTPQPHPTQSRPRDFMPYPLPGRRDA